MARRTKIYKVDDAKSRDHGKAFLLTEMDADSAEWWAFQVLQALVGSDAEFDLSAPLATMHRQGLAALGKLPPEKAQPLLQQMMTCVRVQLDASHARELLPGDIEEVKTRVALRREILELHTGFFELGGG